MKRKKIFSLKKLKKVVAGVSVFAITLGIIPSMPAQAANTSIDVGESITYNYTGNVQTFTAPEYGVYTIACYGAAGSGTGGGGSMTMGTITLKEGETLYITVGSKAGYNGGGAGKTFNGSFSCKKCGASVVSYSVAGYSGGGATDIRKDGTALENRIMVAAGGAGGGKSFTVGQLWHRLSNSDDSFSVGDHNTGHDTTSTISGSSTVSASTTLLSGAVSTVSTTTPEYHIADDGVWGITNNCTATAKGGGGGGYYGGKAGYAGSSYIDSSLFSSTSSTTGKCSSDGYAVITYSQSLFGFADQPSNVTVNELAKATFSVNVTTDCTFQWQVSADNGSTWNNVSGNTYSGGTTNTLTISETPYSYNGYKYRCIATAGTTITSNAATLTVNNGLKFDVQPESKSVFDGVEVSLQAISNYATNYGTFLWQKSSDGSTWSNVSGANKDTLTFTPTLSDSETTRTEYYRCKITSKLDSRSAVYSKTVTVTVARNSYKNIIVAYEQTVEVPKTIDISEVYCTVLYENGTMVQASGWENLHFYVNGNNVDNITVEELGKQTYQVVLVDTVDTSKSKQATLTITGVDTTAPTWIEEQCSVSDYEPVKNSSEISPITISVSAMDNYTKANKLQYALVKGSTTPQSSAWQTGNTFELNLTRNEAYTLYVQDEQGNMNSREYFFNVLDNVAPVISSFIENPDDEIVRTASLIVTAEDGTDENGQAGTGELTYRFYSNDSSINGSNNMLGVVTKDNTVSIKDNGIYYVEVTDKVGNSVVSTALKVDNLDSNPPTADISTIVENGNTLIKISAKDVADEKSTVSGLKVNESGQLACFEIVNDNSIPVEFEMGGSTTNATAIFKAEMDTTYVIKVTDNVGNYTLLNYVSKDEFPPVVTLRSTLSEDRRYGVFEISAVEEENATSKASGLKTDNSGQLACFEVTNEAGKTVNVSTKGTPEESGLYLSANAAFKTNSDEEFTIKVTDNAGNVTTVKATLDDDILKALVDGVISGISGENLNGVSEYPDYTNGSVRLTAYVQGAENNFDWCWDYDSETQTGTWAKGAYGTLNGVTSSYYANLVTENGTYTAYAKDEDGQVYKRSVEVTNIDKKVPTFSATVNGSYIIVTAQDDESGIDYIMIDGGSLETIQQKYCYGAKQTEVYAAVSKNGNYTITVFDKAGNKSDSITKSVQEISEEEYFTVTFCNYDGSVMKAEFVGKGESATPPTNVTREGYIFTGWDKPYVNITEDTKITAVFVPEEDDTPGVIIGEDTYYTVDFLNYDDAVVKSERVISGGTATPPTSMKREGYTFTGWDKSYANVTSNIQVKALFIKDSDDVYYTVDFLTYDDSVIKSERVICGGTATPPTNVTREGYIFNGWDGSYANVKSNIQVKALFIKETEVPSEAGVYYTVDFLTYDNSVIKSEKVLSGESATPPTNVTREGYTFTGWDKSYANVTSNIQVKALFVAGEKSNTSLTGGTGSTTVKEGNVKNSEVGSEFTSETETEVEVIEEGKKVVLLSELTDEAMLLAEYVEKEEVTEEEPLQFFQDEEIADATENLETEEVPTQQKNNILPFLALTGCSGAVIFYFLNKKWMWVDLPF